ncbi:PaaX family transcriptional regulator C-terminal domain-containing protein [Dactylosporangium siamense]|uniref:PaaX family transcriptional regulator n=1 Tax=Dactylosporangium siamense TaxID=685454 RepID=A0A919PG29_9ACTN|nr:PaaX family transcriptional regulator C-terminal domain-containing protein [Dactylosporangium siamense]GIG42591.1 PaaX family transcriptional regulator [Dactylosporangium siamense]
MPSTGRAGQAISRAGFPLVDDTARRPKALILDVFGAYVRQIGGWIRGTDLITFMGALGVDEAGTRAAVARMIDSGLIERVRHDSQRGYALTETSLQLLDEADRRIFATTTAATLADGWVIVSFSVPEAMRSQRHVLRTRLIWLGFGNLGSGLWIAPARLRPELESTITAIGLAGHVDVFVSVYHGFDTVTNMVARSWDLDELRRLYGEFLALSRPVLRRWRRANQLDDAAAFTDYTTTLHRWRRFPYLDPGLPTEVIPHKWEGEEARTLFLELHGLLQERALRHVRETCGVTAS